MSIQLNGSIGYTLLHNEKSDTYILILADNHAELSYCMNNNKFISDWLKEKMDTVNIILEEVPRDDNIKLGELWATSPHTQKLKELFLNRPDAINGFDIRPHLIPFTLKVDTDNSRLNLLHYFSFINSFYKIEHENCKKWLGPIYSVDFFRNSHLGYHFAKNKKEIKETILPKIQSYLLMDIHELKKENNDLFKLIDEMVDYLLSNIMEWFCLALIYKKIYDSKNKKRNFIIHAGLYHTQNIIKNLIEIYNFKIVKQEGSNHMDEIFNNPSGCLQLPYDIDKKFTGGFFHY